MKKIKSGLILVFLVLFGFSSTIKGEEDDVLESCEYRSDYHTCKEANKNGNPRSIEDFVCISSSNKYEILSQIILDREFKKIDKEVESYLKRLEDNKNEFFGKQAQRSLIEGIDEIEDKFSIYGNNSFGKRYMELCGTGIIKKTLDCFGSIPEVYVKDYFKTETCKALVLTKLEIFKTVSYDILKLNKSQIDKDEKKKNTQKRRGKYDKLLEIIMINIGYMERIWKKWPSKTKYPHK